VKSIVESTLEHKIYVQEYTKKLGLKFIEKGETQFGISLIKNGLVHDQSKLQGLELEYLHNNYEGKKPPEFFLALKQHVTTNPHHPEYFEGIKNMPKIYLSELVCDWKARSSELDTCLNDFIHSSALDKFKFSRECEVYKNIMMYKDMLVEKWN